MDGLKPLLYIRVIDMSGTESQPGGVLVGSH
jgi:hypothetical protein